MRGAGSTTPLCLEVSTEERLSRFGLCAGQVDAELQRQLSALQHLVVKTHKA